jgi:hypothetical protein
VSRITRFRVAVILQAPEHLDYFEVTIALCSTLSQFYQKFMDEACAVPHILDALEAMDKKMRVMHPRKTNVSLPRLFHTTLTSLSPREPPLLVVW